MDRQGAAFALAVPLTAQLACAPVLVLLDPSIATYAVPANLVAAPALVPATVLGVLATLVAPWFPLGGTVLAWPAGLAAWWIAAVARFFAALPGARLPWLGGAPGAAALAVLTVAALVLAWRWRRVAGLIGVRVPWSRGAAGRTRGARRCGRGSGRPSRPDDGARPCALSRPGRWSRARWWSVSWSHGRAGSRQRVVRFRRTGPSRCATSGRGRARGPDRGRARAHDRRRTRGRRRGRCLDELGIERLDLLVLTHFHADHVGASTPSSAVGRWTVRW
ncbi:ComEC/Rec2 family competence protein [Oerskovia sp. M15]